MEFVSPEMVFVIVKDELLLLSIVPKGGVDGGETADWSDYFGNP